MNRLTGAAGGNMKRLIGSIKKNRGDGSDSGTRPPVTLPQGDAPEAMVIREVTAFCEAGAPNSPNAGEEYVHLPAIVDATESSPGAAREAANSIKRYLSKDNNKRPFAQYNAIMLLRILTDNPGRDFTQHFDHKFVSTAKELLRESRDASVQQLFRETLDYFEAQKAPGNETLGPLVEMWRKEKTKSVKTSSVVFPTRSPYQGPPIPARPSQPRRLPPPDELAARIEEAKTTARLLVQTVQSTPQHELVANELVREFADRAAAAHRSITQYMNCDNPAPDADTMLTLIETNDQLNIAMSKHQRTLLQARKAMGLGSGTPSPQHQQERNQYFSSPQHQMGQNVYTQPDPNQYSSQKSLRNSNLSNDFYTAPSGPPPNLLSPEHRSHDFAYTNAYASPPVRQPSPLRQNNTAVSPEPSKTAEPPTSDNPFTDDAYAEPQQQAPPPKSYSLFDRQVHSPPPQPPLDEQQPPPRAQTAQDATSKLAQPQIQYGQTTTVNSPRSAGPVPGNLRRTMSDDMYDDDEDDPVLPVRPSGPGPHGDGSQETPSFQHRQETAAATVTMSGASPPPEDSRDTATPRNPPPQELDTAHDEGLDKRMANIRVA